MPPARRASEVSRSDSTSSRGSTRGRQTFAVTACSGRRRRRRDGFRSLRWDAEARRRHEHEPSAGSRGCQARKPEADPPAPHRHLEMAGGDGTQAVSPGGTTGQPESATVLAPSGTRDPPPRGAAAAQARLALYPSLRRWLARLRRSVLGWTADGPRLHARLRAAAPSPARLGGPMDAAGADVGRRARTSRSRVHALAEHGAYLRPALNVGSTRPKASRPLVFSLLPAS